MSDVRIINADCLDALAELPDASVDCVVTDPPYGLEFMGKEWDRLAGDWRTDISPDKTGRGSWFGDNGKAPRYHAGATAQAWHQQWATAVLRTLKPGGYMLCFGGTRTYHRLACAVEDAGFEIRDCLMWVFGSGFPKGKGCLKPAYEPILLCRRPGAKVLPLGIDECRVEGQWQGSATRMAEDITGGNFAGGNGKGRTNRVQEQHPAGRWPANLVHDGSDEVMERFAEFGELTSGTNCFRRKRHDTNAMAGSLGEPTGSEEISYGDTGTAARFFYAAKASRRERGEGNTHPTVKPLALMEWLIKLVAREGETVLDPFLGSGTTARAALNTGRKCIGIERNAEYVEIARRRVAECVGELFAEAV